MVNDRSTPGPPLLVFLRCSWRFNNAMSFIISRLTMILSLILTLLLSLNVKAQQTFFPPAIPLAVRSPYLTCWDYLTNGSVFGQTWPTTFNNPMVYSLHIYLACHESLIFAVSDPRVVSPRTCRRSNLFFPGRRASGR